MNMLFSPFAMGNLRLDNRIVIPPMCQYSADADGVPVEWHSLHYGTLALSGAGLLVVEATAVEPEGRISGNDLGLWSDNQEAAFRSLLATIRRHSHTPVSVQLAHAGRKGSRAGASDDTLPAALGGWEIQAPSALAYGRYPVPNVLDEAGIRRVVRRFGEAAARAGKAGFDAVELHAAHGYLLHQFLSPLANRRNDGYGGTPAKRMRLVLETYDAVREAFAAGNPVGVRISGSDWADGGWTVEDSIALGVALANKGCAYIHVSGGGLSPEQRLRVGPGYQVAMAAAIRRAVSIPVIAVGLITEPEQADTILESGAADMVAVGRGMLYDPRWPWHAAERLGASVWAPRQYLRARPHGRPDLFVQ